MTECTHPRLWRDEHGVRRCALCHNPRPERDVDPIAALRVGRIVTCAACGYEGECWPHPDFPDDLPVVVHHENGTHTMDWPRCEHGVTRGAWCCDCEGMEPF